MSSLSHRSLVFFLLTSALFGQWSKQSFPSTEYLWKVRFADAQTGWVAGHNHLFRTTNGGQSWAAQDTSIGSCDALAVVDANTAIFANWTGAGEKSRGLRRTTDGGATWSTVDAEKNYYTDIEFPTTAVGYASSGGTAGNSRLVKKTTDGGATWTTVSQNFPKGSYELTGIAFPDAQNGWAVSYDGFIYHTTNGGTDWSIQDSLGAHAYRDVDFADANNGWVVGGLSGDQYLAHTTNGGATWTAVHTFGSSIREVELLSPSKGYYAGMNNGAPYIGALTGGGETWIDASSSLAVNGFESIDMLAENDGWAVGGTAVINGKGFLYRAVAPAAVRRESGTPVRFGLQQNFPNPFNPATTIRFSLPERSAVTLRIYAVTGALLDVPVNTTMEAGSYSVPFDASRYASGIYLYTLTAGARTETKRMVLMK